MFGRKKRLDELNRIIGGLDPDTGSGMFETRRAADAGPYVTPYFPGDEAQQVYDPRSEPSAGPDAKPKFFGKGGVGRGIAGTIGDFLMQQSGMAPVYGPAMQRQQEMEQRMQLYQQQRQDEYNDWVKRQQYEAENRQPAPNDTERDYEFIKSQLGEDSARSFLESKANPQQYMQVKDPATGELRIIPVPKGGGATAAGGPQPGMIRNGYRFKGGNPNDPNAWEEMGGAGPAAAPGGFLRRR
jgi:hypothetical protein